MFRRLLNFNHINRLHKKFIVITFTSTVGAIVAFASFGGYMNKTDNDSDGQQVVGVGTQNEYVSIQNNYIHDKIDAYIEFQSNYQPAYQLCIDGKSTISVRTKAELELVIEQVQQSVVGETAETEVYITLADEQLKVDTIVHNKPKLQLKINDIELSTSGLQAKSRNNHLSRIENTIAEFDAVIPEERKNSDSIVNLEFAQSIEISRVTAQNEEVLSVDEAVAILNRTNIEPTIYVVESGDSPSEIASDNDMTLEELYVLNKGLRDIAKGLQVGQKLTVMVPEPELSVVVEENISYYEIVPRENVYVDNNEIYIGTEVISDIGFDGTMEVEAALKTVNGKEISRKVLSTKVITKPKSAVIQKGILPIPPKATLGYFITPTANYRITSKFGSRSRGFHLGVDFATNYGSSIRATDGGDVIIAGWRGGYGNLVVIDHGNGYVTKYGHNSKILVKVGQRVGQSEEIAKAGSTGNSTGSHCHFEILLNGRNLDPLNLIEF